MFPFRSQHCRSCSSQGSCEGVRGLAGDGTEVPLAVACPGEEGDCPALECTDYGCDKAMLSCPEARSCPVLAATTTVHKLFSEGGTTNRLVKRCTNWIFQ